VTGAPKGLVLAGGEGTRLRPLSFAMPKQLVPVANRPVLLHALDDLRAAGVTDVGMVVGDRGAQIRAVVGDGAALGLRITYLVQDRPLGLAHCVRVARDFLGADDFVMYLGDNVVRGGLAPLLADFAAGRPAAQVLLARVADPSACGVADVERSGRIRRVVEKPADPPSDLALIGVYAFSARIHEAVAAIRPSRRGELEITDAIQWLIDHGAPVGASLFTGFWRDTGRVDDLLACNRELLATTVHSVRGDVDGVSSVRAPVRVEPGARVIASQLVGPAVIGADAVIEYSYVGPYTAIGPGCVLAGAGVEDSVVMESTSVRGVHGVIHHSILGRSVDISSSPPEPMRHRLVVPDQSRLEIG
jgi:glucose-1-phosphate thymidylyltransferase